MRRSVAKVTGTEGGNKSAERLRKGMFDRAAEAVPLKQNDAKKMHGNFSLWVFVKYVRSGRDSRGRFRCIAPQFSSTEREMRTEETSFFA